MGLFLQFEGKQSDRPEHPQTTSLNTLPHNQLRHLNYRRNLFGGLKIKANFLDRGFV